MKTSRLEAFSDGVFAIAATLLILDVTADASSGALGGALRQSWAQYAAYAFGFLLIGIWWVNHNIWVEVLAKTDRVHLFLNVGLLSCIAFLPFPIRLIGKHVWDDGARAAVVTFCITATMAAIFANAQWFYSSINNRLISERISTTTLKKITASVIPGIPVNLVALLISIWNPHIGIIVIVLVNLFYVVGTSLGEEEPHPTTNS